MITVHLPSFNGGEYSPLIRQRSDLEKYSSGCRTLENLLITPYGGVKNRPGLAYVATSPGRARLFEVQVSIESSFILEFTDEEIRFFKNDVPIQSGGSDYILASPYSERDLAGITLRSINNVAYITHPSYAPRKLQRLTDELWTLSEVTFSHPPMLTPNLDIDLTMTTSAAGEKNDSITLTASSAYFTSLHTGAYFQLSHRRAPDDYEVKLAGGSSSGTSAEIVIQGTASFRTQGTWNGTFEIQVNRGTSWEALARYSSASDANFSASFEEPDRVKMRLVYTSAGSGSNLPAAFLEAVDPYVVGLVKITGITTDLVATALVVKPVEAGATSVWREGAFSPEKGYPRTVVPHEQRLCFASTETSPQTIWGSALDDYENFYPGTDDSDSWTHTVVSGQQNDIQWMESHKALIIGTTGDEWVLTGSSNDGDSVITPSNVRARRHSSNGSDFVRPVVVDDVVIFAQRGGRVVREMSYSFADDGYKTVNLTLLAEHITGAGVVEMKWQVQPDEVLWCVTKDGRLISLTYDKAQNVWGWARHTTGASGDDFFESVAIRRVEGTDDQVWVVVRRMIDGAAVRYVERLKPNGYFIEPFWSLLYGPTYGLDIWNLLYTPVAGKEQWGNLATYTEGTFVNDGVRMLYCYNTHTTLVSETAPPFDVFTITGTKNFVVATEWASTAGTPFNLNDCVFVYPANHMYRCIQSHTKGTGGTDPAIGGNAYWEDLGSYATVITWTQYETYALNDLVQNDGFVYKCTSAHTSALTYEPGVGGSWTTKWTGPTQEQYLIDDQVQLLGIAYTCIADHTPATVNKPGSGASWETYWVADQGEYTVGDTASVDGVNYTCIQTHTPTAATEPSIGVDWTDYWEERTANEESWFYLDAGVTLINPGVITEVTGLAHLEGETVSIISDGVLLAQREVASGAIQLDQTGDPTGAILNISVGLPFTSILHPLPVEVPTQNGTSVSREKRIHEVCIYFNETYGAKIGPTETGDFDTIAFYSGNLSSPITPFTGFKTVILESKFAFDPSFVLKQDLPLPFHVLSTTLKLNVNGDT